MKFSKLILALAFLIAATTAQAAPDPTGKILVGSSAGFGIFGSEETFITNLEADYFFDRNLSLGGQMLFGFGSFFLFGPQVVGKYTFDITNDSLRDLRPHVEALLGMVVASNGSTEAGFLGGFGFGADYFLRPKLSLGSNMLFEFSNDVGGEKFGWVWKVLNVKYLF